MRWGRLRLHESRGTVLGLALTLLLALAGIGLSAPNRALADDFTSCPSAGDLQNVMSNGGTLRYTGAAQCQITLGGPLTIGSGVSATIDGGAGGLLLKGNTNFVKASHMPSSTSLTLEHIAFGSNQYPDIDAGDSGATIVVTGCAFSGDAEGFGIDAEGVSGTILVTNSTFATGYGIHASRVSGTISVTNSTFIAAGGGMSIYAINTSGLITVTDSTFTTDTAEIGTTGIFAFGTSGTFTVTSSTFSIDGDEGGDSIEAGDSVVVAGSLFLARGISVNCDGVIDGGYNLSTDDSCDFQAGSGSKVVTADALKLAAGGALGDYGGPTQTIALDSGSPAIDAIPAGTAITNNGQSVAICPAADDPTVTDQRGVSRSQGASCDIGAFETIQPPVITMTATPSSPSETGWYNAEQLGQGAALPVTIAASETGGGIAGLSCEVDGAATSIPFTPGATTDTYPLPAGLTDGSHAINCTGSSVDPFGTSSQGGGADDLGTGAGSGSSGTTSAGAQAEASATFKVDTTLPTIDISTPSKNASYVIGQDIDADYSCADPTPGSGITPDNCAGTIPSGSRIDTGSFGSHTFMVEATDNAGNVAATSVTYTVGYAVTTLPGSREAVRRGYYAVIRFAPEDAAGHDYARRNLKVRSVELDGPNDEVIPFSHPFRFGRLGGTNGYQLSINTRNLVRGDWTLVVQIGSGPSAVNGSVGFTVD